MFKAVVITLATLVGCVVGIGLAILVNRWMNGNGYVYAGLAVVAVMACVFTNYIKFRNEE